MKPKKGPKKPRPPKGAKSGARTPKDLGWELVEIWCGTRTWKKGDK